MDKVDKPQVRPVWGGGQAWTTGVDRGWTTPAKLQVRRARGVDKVDKLAHRLVEGNLLGPGIDQFPGLHEVREGSVECCGGHISHIA